MCNSEDDEADVIRNLFGAEKKKSKDMVIVLILFEKREQIEG